MTKSSLSFLILLVALLLIECKDTSVGFSPGAGDARIAGTWQLYERRFIRDSTYSIRVDTLVATRDTAYYAVRRYSAANPQTITFGADGGLSARGSEMTYYLPISYYRLDSTYNGLGVNLYISTNRAVLLFRQGVTFRGDTLVLLPQCYLLDPCDRGYYLKLLRVR